jgi:multidrug efflux pump subunit AcrA (membrane-fusion protein)
MSFIAGLLLNLFQKTAPDFVVPLLVISLAFIFKKRVRLVLKTVRLFYLDKKEYLMSAAARPRLLLLAGILLAVLLVPFSRETLRSEGVLGPVAQLHVEAPEDGTVTAVLARESQEVRKGDVLFRMSSRAVAAAAVRHAEDRSRSAAAARTARSEGGSADAYTEERKADSAAAALESTEIRLGRLAVRSPVSGRVLTPHLEDLEHRFVTAGTLLAEVGDCRQLVAALPVSERLLDDLEVGAAVKAYARQNALGPILGTVRRIAPATAGQPRTAASGTEPPLPAELPDRFVVLAFFENPDGTLRPGSPIRAKIAGPRRSWAARVFRVLGRWTKTVFW